MQNKKIYYGILMFLLLILVVSTTYAFFAPQAGGTTSTNATVTSNTTDLLTFSINRDISFTVTQNDFQENGTNQSGDATATATLTPNNKTGGATMNYYLYLNIEENPIAYSEANTNGLPELMLQVFDGSNQLVTLSDLGNQVTVKGVTGYDITAIEGLQTLLNNHAISASNNTATIENWKIVITLINHDFNQNDNTGKEVSAEIIIQQEELELGYTGIVYVNRKEQNIMPYFLGDPISPVTGLQWVITDGTNYLFSFKDEASCIQRKNYFELGDAAYCAEMDVTSGGISYYETTLNGILTSEYDVYCPMKENDTECAGYNFSDSYDDCQIFMNYYSDEYTCRPWKITKPYYLKINSVNNVGISASACIFYNDIEYCLDRGYWDTNGANTKAKLKLDMESVLGVSADECVNGENYANCEFGYLECGAYDDGSVFCASNGDYSGRLCNVTDTIVGCG